MAGRWEVAGIHHRVAHLADLVLGARPLTGGRRYRLPLGIRVQTIHIHLAVGYSIGGIYLIKVIQTVHLHLDRVTIRSILGRFFDLEFHCSQSETAGSVLVRAAIKLQEIRNILQISGECIEGLVILTGNFLSGHKHIAVFRLCNQFQLGIVIGNAQINGDDTTGGFRIQCDRHIHRIPRIAADSRQRDLHRLGRHGRQHRHAGNQQRHGQQQC